MLPFKWFLLRKPIGIKDTIDKDSQQKESESGRRKRIPKTISPSNIFDVSKQQGHILRNRIMACVIKFGGFNISFA